MPKQWALAMATKNLTGNSKLISIMNGLGHSISRNQAVEYDSALAMIQLQRGEF